MNYRLTGNSTQPRHRDNPLPFSHRPHLAEYTPVSGFGSRRTPATNFPPLCCRCNNAHPIKHGESLNIMLKCIDASHDLLPRMASKSPMSRPLG
jgi:hypothetical protein